MRARMFSIRASRWRAAAPVLAAALWLAGCGGGISIGVGSRFGFDDTPPSVNVTTAATSVAAGQLVRFVAAATDDNGVAHVSFYRLDAGGAVLLGSDSLEPYEWTAVAPADGRASLVVFARAVDHDGNTADSPTVSVTVTVTP